jgi:ubiquinone/menaquinone biosynthesis C-methylase UbiE
MLTETLDLGGRRVCDVGSGDGAVSRLMTRAGAHVIGIECGAGQLAKAEQAPRTGDETYIKGVGEDLPLENASQDIVVFFGSLHHIPAASQGAALREAARVIRPGGRVYIAEPLAEGVHFEMIQPFHDETAVRAEAHKAIKNCAAAGLVEEKEFFYVNPVKHADFDAFRERMIRINPDKSDKLAENESALRANFDRMGTKTDDGVIFDQPMRVNILLNPAT